MRYFTEFLIFFTLILFIMWAFGAFDYYLHDDTESKKDKNSLMKIELKDSKGNILFKTFARETDIDSKFNDKGVLKITDYNTDSLYYLQITFNKMID